MLSSKNYLSFEMFMILYSLFSTKSTWYFDIECRSNKELTFFLSRPKCLFNRHASITLY